MSGTGSVWNAGSVLNVGDTGDGALTIAGGGSVKNSGIAVLGNVAESNGTALVTGAGSTWTAGTELFVGSSGTGALTIGSDAVVSSPSLTLAAFSGSTGSLNIEGGTLQADSIAFGQGSGTINFNSAGDYTFSPAINGDGTLNMLSGTTFLTADSSAFTGITNLTGGDLIVDGVLGGVINVGHASMLGGTGIVGSTIVGSGGTLSPGNSIGTISVNGSLTFGQGSVYQVEVDSAGNNDSTLVSGAPTLTGGHVDVIAATGNWQAATSFTILSAAGGLNGTHFLDVSSNLQFLVPALTYNPNDVILTLRVITSPPTPDNDDPVVFAAIAKTPNQKNAAESVDDFFLNDPDTDNPLIGKLLGLDKATAPLTIAQLPGEIHASLAGVLLDDSRFIQDAANNRLRSAFGDVTAPSVRVLAYGPDGVEPQAATNDRFAVWGQGFGSWADWESNDQVPGVDRSVGGFIIGGDASFGDRARIGILSGYSHASINESGLGASANVDNFHLGIYGGAEFGAFRLRSGTIYTWHDISTDRSVQFTGSQEHLSADYNGGTAQIFGELGYSIQYNSVALEPFANLSYANLHLDSFTEEGGASALTAASSNTDITFSTLGLRGATQLSAGSAEATLRGTIGWRHAYGDVTPETSLAFSGMGSFEISGLPIARDAALLELGVDIDLAPAATFGLSYQGQIAGDIQDHGFKADLTMRF